MLLRYIFFTVLVLLALGTYKISLAYDSTKNNSKKGIDQDELKDVVNLAVY